jgi:hypothetical protein
VCGIQRDGQKNVLTSGPVHTSEDIDISSSLEEDTNRPTDLSLLKELILSVIIGVLLLRIRLRVMRPNILASRIHLRLGQEIL